MATLREVRWVGSAKRDLLAMPDPVRKGIGFVLDRVQRGQHHTSIKPLKGLGGVYEIRLDYDSDTYRGVYAVNVGTAIYVLHVFKKKSKRGIETPKQDIELIRNRLRLAQEDANEN
jgi:phage-related protein